MEVAAQHHRAAYVGDGHAQRAGERLVHHPFERTLTQLADDQPDQKVLLFAGRPG